MALWASDVAIIADNQLSIAERLRLRWSIILFINRLSPMLPKAAKAKTQKTRIALSTKQSAGRVGFKWIMASVTLSIWPNQHGPSSYLSTDIPTIPVSANHTTLSKITYAKFVKFKHLWTIRFLIDYLIDYALPIIPINRLWKSSDYTTLLWASCLSPDLK